MTRVCKYKPSKVTSSDYCEQLARCLCVLEGFTQSRCGEALGSLFSNTVVIKLQTNSKRF